MSVEPTEEELRKADNLFGFVLAGEHEVMVIEEIAQALATLRVQYEKRIKELETSLGTHITQKNQHYEEVLRCHKLIEKLEKILEDCPDHSDIDASGGRFQRGIK